MGQQVLTVLVALWSGTKQGLKRKVQTPSSKPFFLSSSFPPFFFSFSEAGKPLALCSVSLESQVEAHPLGQDT